jgi:hypothetical protein
VYEDEQSFCDMDGSKLAFDSHQLPKLQALTNAPEFAPAKAFWRARLVPAAAGLVLATVLGLVYYVSMQPQPRPQPQPTPAAQSRPTISLAVEEPGKSESAQNTAVPATVAEEKSATADHKPAGVAEEKPGAGEAKPGATDKPEVAEKPASKKPRPVTLNTTVLKPAKLVSTEAKPKKESKVSAVLKKTGRILKKPFKF